MAETPSLVRTRLSARAARGCRAGLVIAVVTAFLLLDACTPVRQVPLELGAPHLPHFDVENDRFVSFDGAELGLTVWQAEGTHPELVVIGLHGMNDYANAFHMAAPWWSKRGVTVYAYDQRGFGRSPGQGIWPQEALLRRDLRTAVKLARARHPDATLAVVGISMGAAVAMSSFTPERPLPVDRLVLSGPGVRGWGALPLLYRASLWASAHLRPGWVVRPPRRFVKIEPSDNLDMLRRASADPLMQFVNRIDQVHGVVALMESAHDCARNLPEHTLIGYGARDIVIPDTAMARTAGIVPGHVRSAFYEDGYHMLLRDLQAETVWRDYLAFMRDPSAPLPSGAPALPWLDGSG